MTTGYESSIRAYTDEPTGSWTHSASVPGTHLKL